jgi:hypothetical protein
MQIHIGDYSCDREDVEAYCGECLLDVVTDISCDGVYKIFIDRIERRSQVENGYIGQVVLFLCKDENGYDIHLN